MHTANRRSLALMSLVAFLTLVVPLGITLAGATFNDVSSSNPFRNDIAAIANAGVTTGCGGGNYCPKENVTREQMAAFMNRLGALDSSKKPVVNADKLDGYNSTAFARVAYATMRPDECFHTDNACTTYNTHYVSSIRRVATGTYCVAPTGSLSFAGTTPSFSTDNYNSGPGNGFGVPAVAYSSYHFYCVAKEVEVVTYRGTGSPVTMALSDSTSFGIVIPMVP